MESKITFPLKSLIKNGKQELRMLEILSAKFQIEFGSFSSSSEVIRF